jgi:hypothetical protein
MRGTILFCNLMIRKARGKFKNLYPAVYPGPKEMRLNACSASI